jgi:hypothetical protein
MNDAILKLANLAYFSSGILHPIWDEFDRESVRRRDQLTKFETEAFWACALLESLLWLRTGVQLSHFDAGQVKQVISRLESSVVEAYRQARYSDATRIVEASSQLLKPGSEGPEIDYGFFSADQRGDSVEESIFGNWYRGAAEYLLNQNTATMLTAINFADNEEWRMAISDGYFKVPQIAIFLDATVTHIVFSQDLIQDIISSKNFHGLSPSTRLIHDAQVWKLDFASGRVSDRFSELASIALDAWLESLNDGFRQTALRNTFLLLNKSARWWLSDGRAADIRYRPTSERIFRNENP